MENKEKEERTLEEMFADLEEIADKMEEDISLEDSFGLYHRAMDMLKACGQKLDKVEKQILLLDEETEAF